MPTENLALWQRLERTDPKATKPFTRSGGFRGTQIDPTWRIKRMTEEFGPVGRGWGWEQVAFHVTHDMVFVCARVWYALDGARHVTGEQWGGTELLRRRRDGNAEPNDEAFKMAMTDAVGKCCVQIGLSADVHLGLFDDSKYREESDDYYRQKEADKKAAEPPPPPSPAKLKAAATAIASRLKKADQIFALELAWEDGKDTIAKLPEVTQAYLQKLYDKRRTAMEQAA